MAGSIADDVPLSALEMGVYKYVIVDVPVDDSCVGYIREVRVFDAKAEHASQLHKARGEELVAAGFIAIDKPGSFLIQDANSGSLNHKGNPWDDEIMFEELTELKCARPKVRERKADDADETKVLTRHYAYISYSEARAICELCTLDVESILNGFAFYIPQTRVRISFEARKRGWMLSAYSDNADEITRALQSVMTHGRIQKAQPGDPLPF
jgi:hypothetical protein